MDGRVLLPVVAGLVVLSACGSGGSETSQPAPASAAPTTSPTAAPGLPQACARYRAASTIARQVVTSAAEPVLASAPAFVLLGVRQGATDAAAAAPTAAPVFGEVVAAVDDLDAQAVARLPSGADGSTTLVQLQPQRLGAALDAADALCRSAG
ncbi:hypothetical protein [Rhodococcus sp. X156]|uniref:hypothetical protein n=1 Tax=Rhodococcus sp. X156 TaxID=2499145 RepID=UPI000FDA4A7B|nr:hypothetical protein [Rhodococcus sp. X156]